MPQREDVFKLYNKYNVRASKKFGQNFLISSKILNQITQAAAITHKDVVEIGSGLGFLTAFLLQSAQSVWAYEIDPDMQRVLRGELTQKNLVLKDEDFLKAKFNWTGVKTIVANIPYNITSPILFKIFKYQSKFLSATLMVQKEVGERLIAKPQSNNYGKLSVTAQYFAKISVVTYVPPQAFVPVPKVESIVIKMEFNNNIYDQKLLDFFKLCFNQQRKTLVNNLKQDYPKSKITAILERLAIKINVRPQELHLNQLLLIYNSL